MNLLMYMVDCSHTKVDCQAGKLEDLTISEICSLGGCSEQEAWDFLEDALKHEFCDIEMDKNAVFHVMSRRLSRDASKRGMWRKQKQNQRNQQGKKDDNNNDVRSMSTQCPPLSPTPSPSKPPQTPPGGLSKNYSKSFLEFWEVCPWKVGKDAAFKIWKQIGSQNNGTSPHVLINAMRYQVAQEHFQGQDGKDYYPKPETWLKDGRWKDEVKIKTPTRSQSNYRFPICGSCGYQASNIKRGEQCPYCGELA